MRIETSRFGPLEISEDQIITLTHGLLGFPNLRRFLLIDFEEETPFQWLQGVDEPSIAFVVINPHVFSADYEFPLPAATAAELGLEKPEDLAILVLVTIPPNPREITANLKGPLLFNTKTRKGAQLVLDDDRYALKHPILAGARP